MEDQVTTASDRPRLDAIVSRANLNKKGPRLGLSSEESSGFGDSGGGFLAERAGFGLDREGEGDGSFLLGVRGGF